jgi:hypothetical protein
MKVRIILLALGVFACAWAVSGRESSSAGDEMPGDIAGYNSPAPRSPLEANLPPSGGFLVRTRGCLRCHSLGEQGARGGPDLSNVGRRLNAEAIERLLMHPRDVNPDATMPDPPLTRGEVLAIAEYLSQVQ